jgi:hypothetical protein
LKTTTGPAAAPAENGKTNATTTTATNRRFTGVMLFRGQRRRHVCAQLSRSRCDDARTSLEVERRSLEGWILEELDRVALLADELTAAMSTERAAFSEQTASTPAVGEVAERDGERAEDPRRWTSPTRRRRASRPGRSAWPRAPGSRSGLSAAHPRSGSVQPRTAPRSAVHSSPVPKS